MPLHLPVLLGTARKDNRTQHVARFVVERLEARQGVTTSLQEPVALPFDQLIQREWKMDPQPEAVTAFVEEMALADGFVLCSPEYNHGYPGALKNVLDHLADEWTAKPFAMVTTGGVSGGARAAELLRVVVSGLGAISIPSQVIVQRVKEAFGPEGPADVETWTRRVDDLLDELAWYAQALARQRSESALP